MSLARRILFLLGMLSTVFVGLLGGGVARATPAVDVTARLIAAGVPADIAAWASLAQPAVVAKVMNLAHPTGGFPGSRVDAVIDHRRKTVTIVQRSLVFEASRLSVGWVNLKTGRSGIASLPNAVPGLREDRYPTTDRAGLITTGGGPVVIVVYGRIPAWTGSGLAPEHHGLLTPTGRLLHV